jgi:hypothetical protein
MTVRRRTPDGEGPEGHETETRSVTSREQPLLTQRAALILITALVIAAAAGILAYLAGARPPEAVLAGGAACAGAITFLHTLID